MRLNVERRAVHTEANSLISKTRLSRRVLRGQDQGWDPGAWSRDGEVFKGTAQARVCSWSFTPDGREAHRKNLKKELNESLVLYCPSFPESFQCMIVVNETSI